MLTPASIASPDAEKKMVGSLFICEAESLDAVRELMESDVYHTAGVVSVFSLGVTSDAGLNGRSAFSGIRKRWLSCRLR